MFTPTRLAAVLALIAAAPLSAAPLATVNGTAIGEQELAALQEEREGLDRQQALNELVARELLYQDAQAKELGKRPEVQQRLDEVRREVLIGAAIERAMDQAEISEAQLRAQYEILKPRMTQQEFHARHILVEEKETAEQLIAQLKDGADFAELAKEHSTGPTGERGGDLGWFSANQMVPAFSEAAAQLQPGAITEEPVQTQFGWHVIKLEDTRSSEPPSFEQVEPQLRQAAQRQQIAQYLEKLRQDAEIAIEPAGE